MKIKFYNDIGDLPAWNFIQITTTGEMQYLCRDIAHELKEKDKEELDKCWEKIEDQFMDEFGITDDFRKDMNQEKQYWIYKLEYAATGNSIAKSRAKAIEIQMEKTRGQTKENTNFNQLTITIEKHMGFSIDIKTIDTRKYFSYVRYVNERAKEIINMKQKDGKENRK